MKAKYWFILGAIALVALLYKCNQIDIERRNAEQSKPQFKHHLEQALGREVTKEEMEAIRTQQQNEKNELDAQARRQLEAEQRRKSGCGGVDLAVAAEQYVKRKLKTPSVAEFSTYTEKMHGEENGRLYYLGYVDSQNGFGAIVRTYFKIWMTCSSGDITVVDAEFEET